MLFPSRALWFLKHFGSFNNNFIPPSTQYKLIGKSTQYLTWQTSYWSESGNHLQHLEWLIFEWDSKQKLIKVRLEQGPRTLVWFFREWPLLKLKQGYCRWATFWWHCTRMLCGHGNSVIKIETQSFVIKKSQTTYYIPF